MWHHAVRYFEDGGKGFLHNTGKISNNSLGITSEKTVFFIHSMHASIEATGSNFTVPAKIIK
jgi:hypothetical protein